MKRLPVLLCLLVISAPPRAGAAGERAAYGWRISASDVDPLVNRGGPPPGALTLCLWLECSVGDGISAAEFDLVVPDGVVVLGFTPRNGFLNGGDAEHLALAVGGCPVGPALVGEWQLGGALPGSYCLAPTGQSGMVGAVDCDPRVPRMHPSDQVGYGAAEAPACDEGGRICATTAVAAAGWGRIKSLYR